jgi:endonuclease/exonuclease/phosphatase family metal-dependent hydrolase
MRVSIANRRKQLAQAIWLRARIEDHLAANAPLIVLGDLNDGPGLDEYEHLFGRSSVEIIMDDDLRDPHARQAMLPGPAAYPTSARFARPDQGRFLHALLDYIMVSPDLMRCDPRWRIWHPFEDAGVFADAPLREALLTASDHFPVTLDFDPSRLRGS